VHASGLSRTRTRRRSRKPTTSSPSNSEFLLLSLFLGP
jgi:hypothetical protein